MQLSWKTLLVISVAGALSACSSDKKDPTGNGGSGGGASSEYENNGEGVCKGSTRPANDQFCQNTCVHDGASTCPPGRPIDSCCVQVGEPGRSASNPHLKRTSDTKEFSGSGDPNLSCFEEGSYPSKPPAGGSSMTATLKGVIKTFANGGCAAEDLIGNSAVTVEVFKVKRTGDPATDGALGDLVGTALTANDQMPIVQEDVTNCNGDPRLNRAYEYPNVPMYTELVVRSSGNGWRPLHAYNIYITESDKDYDMSAGTYKYDVRALAEDDYNTIPSAAIGQTITPGNGAIGGEVHDCDNVRLQFARVDISVSRKGLEYFNDDEDDPLPDTNRRDVGTGRTALYSALDVKVDGTEGTFARVAGTGLIPGAEGKSKLVSLGYCDVRVFPNSISSCTLRGLRGYQVP